MPVCLVAGETSSSCALTLPELHVLPKGEIGSGSASHSLCCGPLKLTSWESARVHDAEFNMFMTLNHPPSILNMTPGF